MYQRILVPIDGSDVSNAAVQEAARLARELHSQLCLVHVIDLTGLYWTVGSGVPVGDIERGVTQGGEQELNQAKAIAAGEGINPETTLIRSESGRLSMAIIDYAKRWSADLIVMGAHGLSGLDRLFLGSVAEGVARSAPVPVLLVRGSDVGR